ncbi:MAG: hypothetical protein IJV06_03745 [Bacteroidaceae bacterium]|nr:hypothetical protein [Bacteroidaceae bacterium]
MKKTLLFAASLMVSVCSWADWVKPAAPASAEMKPGEELYLYNQGADGFLCGANDYGTRASVSPTLGHKVYIEQGKADGSYYITNYVLSGWMANQVGYMFMDNLEAIYVDNTKDGKTNNQYTLELQADGTYKIGLSEANADLNPKNYPGAYLGLIPQKEDTRIYVCDPENELGYQMSDCQLTWYFVAPSAYELYVAAMKQYLAAVSLGKAIAEAEALEGVDAQALAEAKAVYSDTEATPEALAAQQTALEEAMKNAKYNVASVENPVEVLSLLGIATDFNDGEFTGWTSTTGAQNKQASNGNNAKDFSITGNHYENWHWEAMSTGKVSASLNNLPKGVYHLNALAYTTTVGGTYLFAGTSQKKVTSTQIDIEQPMDIYTVVTTGELEIGLDVQQKGTNWIGLDNVQLFYLGDSEEARSLLIEETLAGEPDYESLFAEGEAACQKKIYDAYLKAKEGLEATDESEALSQAITAFNKAAKDLAESVAAYATYQQKVNEADNFLSGTTSESDEVLLLSDYVYEDTAAEGLYNGNGGAAYILMEGLLDNTQIAAETAYLDQLLKEAMANAMSDGDDCTALLVNPNFAETGGWTSAVGPTWPEGNTETFPVMQAHNMVCNVYQELKGLQNGLYEFNLQAAFRPGGDYAEENEAVAQAYAYINSFETKIPSGAADNLNEPAEASAAFAEGKYPVKVYGLVTDGTMKLGVTNKVRSVENCRLWAGGATLTFRSKNEEVLAQVIAEITPKAQALQSNYAGMPELAALSDAIAAADGAEDGYEALITLKNAMEAVEASTAAYTNLAVALKSLSDAIETATSARPATVKAAQDLLDEAQAAYDTQAYGTAEAEQAISDLNAAVVSLKMGGGNASEDNPIDYSDMIVNNKFDPARGDKNSTYIEGWTTTGMNGYKEYTVSYNRSGFELNQKLSGLPKGNYKVTVHTYYRAGYWNEEEQYMAEGTETHLTTFYAATADSTYAKPCLNLTEGATDYAPEGITKYYTLSNGLFAPDGTSPTAAWFAAGEYLNELRFYVGEDGEVTIGLSKKDVLPNDYQVVGEWNLYYMGDTETADTMDVTELIVNPTFDPARGDKNTTYIEGWTTTGMNGYKEYTVSYNRSGFELYQDLSGLPEGNYIATVHTYYRAGYWNEEEQYMAEGTETHLTTLYAATTDSTFAKPCLNLTEGATNYAPEGITKYYTLSNGLLAPDGTSPTAAWFAAGEYLNKIEFVVPADGKVRIGLSKKETLPNDYQVVGAWNLYYLGKVEAHVTVQDITDLIDKYLEQGEGGNISVQDITDLIDKFLAQ